MNTITTHASRNVFFPNIIEAFCNFTYRFQMYAFENDNYYNDIYIFLFYIVLVIWVLLFDAHIVKP